MVLNNFKKIIGPYFFIENDKQVSVNVNDIQCRIMIANLLKPEVENNPEVWFQQDGATARPTMAFFWAFIT